MRGKVSVSSKRLMEPATMRKSPTSCTRGYLDHEQMPDFGEFRKLKPDPKVARMRSTVDMALCSGITICAAREHRSRTHLDG